MPHRTQLYLDDDQYRWLKQRAGRSGTIAAVVRSLIDAARKEPAPDAAQDPLIRYLLEDPGEGPAPSTVETLDKDIYAT
ncbi:MAG: hypothetical protein M3R01_02770 [Actinomycetota bacterium]|nr:hypothetical protein [Actinomycetota bacterium]